MGLQPDLDNSCGGRHEKIYFFPFYFIFSVVYFDSFFIQFNLSECLFDIHAGLFELGFEMVGSSISNSCFKMMDQFVKNKKRNRGLTSIF